MRILIANRGEIARRIQRSAARLGHETVAVYAEPDRGAPFVAEATAAVPIGPAALDASYLNADGIVAAALRSSADAVHPGYGFLAENAAFARAVVEAGLLWIGPSAKAIEQMGSKIEARRVAEAAGVPVIPGYGRSQAPADLARAAERIGYPVLVKAAAGGGGKGIRIVRSAAEFAAAVREAAREAERSFGDAALIVERYVERARHVEVQVAGDRHGGVIDLGTRECSIQRRYQKLLEEAPAPNLPEATRRAMCEAARELAGSIGYDSLGTVEFVVDADGGDFYFLEMNTRLQVEHPVTEAITGLDLVALQIGSAAREPLPLRQDEVRFRGHAFEARINAEDAAADFAPQIGSVTHLRVPPGVRWESGVEAGSAVTPYYDALLAKLVVHGPDRESARRRLARALDELVIGGVVSNAGFQRWLVDRPEVVSGAMTTRFLDECGERPREDPAEAARWAARAWRAERERARRASVWSALGAFRITPHRPAGTLALVDRHGAVHEVEAEPVRALGPLLADGSGVARRVPAVVDAAARTVAVNRGGHTHTFRVLSRSERWAPTTGDIHGGAQATVAPFPASVTEVAVAPGDRVAAGEVVVVIEAMKMLHSLAARGAGVVAEVRVSVGDSVESGQVLVVYADEAAAPRPAEGD